MPSERVSRERRERVASLIWQWDWDNEHEGKICTIKPLLSESYIDIADAVTKAALPERTAFEAALSEVIGGAFDQGIERGFSEYRPANAKRRDDAIARRERGVRDLWQLVYGADDASGEE